MKTTVAYVSNTSSLETVRSKVLSSRAVGIDTETTGLDPISNKIRLLQVATDREVFVLDLFRLPVKAVRDAFLSELLWSEEIVKIAQNWKFDCKFIEKTFGNGAGLYSNNIFDTMLAAKLIYGGTNQNKNSLDDLAAEWLQVHLPKDLQKADWSGTIYKEHITYAGLDAAILLPLYRAQCESLAENQLLEVAKIEFECTNAVARMELDGFKVDRESWLAKCNVAKEEAYELELKLREQLGVKDINLNSHQQMTEILTKIAGVPVTSVAQDYLKAFAEDYEPVTDMFGNTRDIRPVLSTMLSYAKHKKDLSSFGFEFLKFIHPVTGRIHANYNQMGADATHRFSCSRPNLQQMPRSPMTRQCFVAEEGNKLITSDISQIELRIIADQTGEESLRDAFEKGIDVHLRTAAQHFGKDVDKVSKEEREFMKPLNYGVPYGMGAKSLAFRTGMTVEEAQKTLRKYREKNRRISERFRYLEDYFKRYNCVRSASGRMRVLNQWHRGEDEYFKAVQASKNFPIQSTCADMIKVALTNLHREFTDESIKLCGSVHDEIIVETKEKDADEIAEITNRMMAQACEMFLKEGTPVEVGTGEPSKFWEK